MKKHVVKRKGLTEPFDEKKVYASCYAAALNCHYSEKEAEQIAQATLKKVNLWISHKKVVHSKEIRASVLRNLKDADVALMYKHHLDLS